MPAKIQCTQCRLITTPDEQYGSFLVQAPVTLPSQDHDLCLILRCTIKADGHRIELERVMDSTGAPAQLTEAAQAEIRALLHQVAQHRVCGSQKICPAEVVRLVQQQ